MSQKRQSFHLATRRNRRCAKSSCTRKLATGLHEGDSHITVFKCGEVQLSQAAHFKVLIQAQRGEYPHGAAILYAQQQQPSLSITNILKADVLYSRKRGTFPSW